MSASLVVAALSVVRLVGMGARRMRRTKTSDSVAGFMLQRPSRHHAVHKQGERGAVWGNRIEAPLLVFLQRCLDVMILSDL